MENSKWNIGVCSWSLQAGLDEVVAAMKTIDVDHVHLAVGPALDAKEGPAYLTAVKQQSWTISCTMIGFEQEDYSTLDTIKVTGGVVPDQHWPGNKAIVEGAAKVTRDLGVPYLSFHAGFIDEGDPAKYKVMCERLTCLADIAAAQGIMLLMETGQETAEELASFMKALNHPALGINYDPANMILYGKGNPLEGLKVLAPWIKHIHIKDATQSDTPGQWGAEVPWSQGQVNGEAFLATLTEIGYRGTLAIEREAGDDRPGDIALAAKTLRQSMS
ncbi:MAG: sugar phosphate isomerase/epimerase [Planctomycetes bacterium]|nr:sugar phosphate isomerase/epimerase [Planctomycetota bacterium]